MSQQDGLSIAFEVILDEVNVIISKLNNKNSKEIKDTRYSDAENLVEIEKTGNTAKKVFVNYLTKFELVKFSDLGKNYVILL